MAWRFGYIANLLLAVDFGISLADSGAYANVQIYAPPPPPPPLGPACTVCVDYNLTIPASADPFRTYAFVTPVGNDYNAEIGPEAYAQCVYLYNNYGNSYLSFIYYSLAAQSLVTPAPVVFNITLCSPKVLRWCAGLPSKVDAEVYKSALANISFGEFEPYFKNYVCPFLSSPGYFVTYGVDSCGKTLKASSFCGPVPDPFPGCKCNKTQGITDLMVDPDLTQLPGRTNKTNLYCFRIRDSIAPVQSSCSSRSLSKVEIWADSTKRRAVKGIRVTPNGGSSKWLPVSWGPSASNTIKATSLNWSITQAIGGEVCIEVTKDIELYDLCMGTSCYLGLFNEKRDCCPAYPSSPSNFVLPV